MSTIKHPPQFLLRRKFFLYLPCMVIPSLLLLFYSFGGGKGSPAHNGKDSVSGYNANLPGPGAAANKQPKNKMDIYQQADADSIRRRESQRQDPYHAQPLSTAAAVGGLVPGGPDSAGCPVVCPPGAAVASAKTLPPEDPHAVESLRKLAMLQKALQRRTAVAAMPTGGLHRGAVSGYADPVRSADAGASLTGDEVASPAMRKLQTMMKALQSNERDSADRDPQLEKLNGMLDKIIRIQHPADGEEAGEAKEGAGAMRTATDAGGREAIASAYAGKVAVTAIPAVVQEDQVLVAGATIALRLTDSAVISGVRIPRDQLVYGIVSINQDRMPVIIQSIRQEHVLIPTALQVYDMDGLPGIHIPSSLNRDVARQSADQGVGSVGLTSADPSIGAQAASAGIQAARTLLSRKVRLVRVSVKAGYQVLLKDMHAKAGRRVSVEMMKDLMGVPMRKDSMEAKPKGRDTTAAKPVGELPFGDSLVPFLHHRVHNGKMELILEGTYLREGMLWMSLGLHNHSAIDYVPQYSLWTIRDRHMMARTAKQAIQIQPAYSGVPAVVRGDSSCRLLIGFRPFALARDKELVWEIAEKDGARMLGIRMGEKVILKSKKL